MTYLLLIAAGVLLLWPRSVPATVPQSVLTPLTSLPTVAKTPSYHSSLIALSTVRQRLAATSLLSDKCSQAIDELVLALVHGSDQP